MDFGHWQYIGEFEPDQWFGFIYRIIDTDSGQEYIGKKQFERHLKKKVKTKAGGTMNRRIKKTSDWRSYTSSSTHVNAAIEAKGKEVFLFLIESLHKTKASLHYAEIEKQINENVLRARFDNGERKYYNRMIGHIKFIPPDEIPEETRQKISNTLRVFWMNTDHHYYNMMSEDERQEWDRKYRLGDRNATMRDKSVEEYLEWKKQHYDGEANPMYGVRGENHPRFSIPHTEDTKRRLSEINTGKHVGELNNRYGKSHMNILPMNSLKT